ncbi:MAG: glycoside hydrolase family 3 N-terminal domain-containing protein [Pseudomonadota bacterium]
MTPPPPIDTGLHLILRIDEPTLSAGTREVLRELRPVGVHFGRDAFLHDEPYATWAGAFQRLRTEIQRATARPRMVYALDHEGGRVHRVPAPLTHFPYPLNWQDDAAAVGRAIGTELRALGCNVVFGPCLDVFGEPDNRVIGPRAFGVTAAQVMQHAVPYIEAVEAQGVRAVGKHFPGHGSTLLDSHFDLPTLDTSLADLVDGDLTPFIAAAEAALGAVMSAHIRFNSIDPQWPASLSPIITQQLLRERLGYAGVVIADDFDMKAVADRYHLEVLAERMLAVPIDMVIFNHHYERAKAMLEEMHRRGADDAGARVRLGQARARVESWLAQLPPEAPTVLDAEQLAAHDALAQRIGERYSVQIEEFTGA